MDLKDNNGVDDGCSRQKEIFLQPQFCIFVLLIYQIRCSHVASRDDKEEKGGSLRRDCLPFFPFSLALYSLLKVFIVSSSKKWLRKTCLFREKKYETMEVSMYFVRT